MTGRRERKVVTVLFADLAGFTSRAESMDPEDVAEPRCSTRTTPA
jgi:class 3 adenylate cyclase